VCLSSSETAPPVLVILGPTGVGKTSAALDVCRDIGGEVISCDSMQVYRGFDIGTAKPTWQERQRVAHHVIDVCDPCDVFSAADFVKRTIDAIALIERRGRLPVVVGGTGLYLRALLEGIFEGPPRDPGIRARLREEAESEGIERLHERLGQVDPNYQARIHPRDRVRIVRALEVHEITGAPLSRHFDDNSLRLSNHRCLKIGLLLPRAHLYDRIDRRVDVMLAAGLVDETRALLSAGVPGDATPFKGLGYAQICAHLDGRLPLDAIRIEIQKETRRYAKRQMTWFRRERGVIWMRADRPEWVVPLVRQLLL